MKQKFKIILVISLLISTVVKTQNIFDSTTIMYDSIGNPTHTYVPTKFETYIKQEVKKTHSGKFNRWNGITFFGYDFY